MTDYGTLMEEIDSSDDVRVFVRHDKEGTPIFSVIFKNREVQFRRLTGGILLVALLACLIFGVIGFAMGSNYWPFAGLGIGVLLTIGTIATALPIRSNREIIIDFASDRFYGKRDGRIEFDQRLSALHSLAVEDHPGTSKDLAKIREKEHVLVGRFGPQGKQRVDLVYRREWPKRYSLQEVQTAIVSVLKKVADHSPAIKASD